MICATAMTYLLFISSHYRAAPEEQLLPEAAPSIAFTDS